MPTPDASVVAPQLADTELFRGLAPDALAVVASHGRVQLLPRGTILFVQGKPADRGHALLSGRVRIAQSGSEGGKLLVRFVGAGETFGTVALFTDRRYPAEASAVIDSVEISWSEQTLLELIHRYPQISLNLVRVIGARLREVQERLRESATQPVGQRVANALLRLADCDSDSAAGDTLIEFPITRQDVAEMCGSTLYTVSRLLTAWEKAGYIATHRKRLSIRNLAEIRRLAGWMRVDA